MSKIKESDGEYLERHMSSKMDLKTLGESQKRILLTLLQNGQDHIFAQWIAGNNENQKLALLNQALALDKACLGGLEKYIKRTKDLLEKSRKNINPLKGWAPLVPKKLKIDFATEPFNEAERKGMEVVPFTAFVLVAGGLGERLHYPGIKIALKCELTTEKSFFQFYAEYILAYQKRGRKSSEKPDLLIYLAIMTSDDTHQKTVNMLEKNNFFGLSREQVDLLKQEKVPSVIDNKARFQMSKDFEIETKPHGHGDVHALLLNSVLEKWSQKAVKYILFFNDTNILVFKAVPALLGSSVIKDFEMNFLVVPRRAGEAVGSICQLKNSATNRTMTCNVEYNQFDSMTIDSGVVDEKNSEGFSSFPGNTNVFVVELAPYYSRLKIGGGRMPEFINPKYADETKTTFKSSTRGECLMQDYSMLIEDDKRVGCTELERWLSFSAAKNNIEDAIEKLKQTGFSESVGAAESALYHANRSYLQQAGVQVALSPSKVVFKGLQLEDGAHVLLEPSFGCTFEEMRGKIVASKELKLSDRSTLVLGGEGLVLDVLNLDGALIARGPDDGGKLLVSTIKAERSVWVFGALEAESDADLLARGYRLEKIKV